MNVIERPHYLDAVTKCFGKDTIVILTGQRRIGKSCLLRQLKARLSASAGNNVIYIDKEKYEFDSIRTCHDLNLHLRRFLLDGLGLALH